MTDKERLVVIGNGMAGARFVEETLARGGGDQYEIVMFGEEPHGNYNRILLSSVLAGCPRPGRHLYQRPVLVRGKGHQALFRRQGRLD